ncbi:MAG: protease HtpX [Deltaproteobacteria bacterium]|nr:protease HtpX [Deltaproteobacteria bacterium]
MMFRRIGLFLLTNLLVVLTLGLLMEFLGVRPYLNQHGLDYEQLAAFCLLWGMGGAFISLGISRWMAKRAMGVRLITEETRDARLKEVRQMVATLARRAGLPMPEVGYYESPDPNAFATGPSKKRSLVAVSTGLLERMNREELEGVLSHEVSHVANGDMVTMALLQGVVNAFAMFLSRLIAYTIMVAMRGDNRRNNYWIFHLSRFAVEIVLMILGSMVVAYFSRYREYHADAGGAKLSGKPAMIGALKSLQRLYPVTSQLEAARPDSLKNFQISTKTFPSWRRLFSSHPPLEDRIARLEGRRA